MACQGFTGSILKMVKVSNECKILCVFKNVTLSKNIVFSFKSIAKNAETSCVVVRRGPTADMKKIKEYLSPALSWGIFCAFSTPVIKNADIL